MLGITSLIFFHSMQMIRHSLYNWCLIKKMKIIPFIYAVHLEIPAPLLPSIINVRVSTAIPMA